MDQGGRPGVEEMGVVDEHHQRTPLGPLHHRLEVAAQELAVLAPGQAIVGRVGRQSGSERPERQPPRRSGGGRAGERHAPLLGQLHGGGGQRRLAHPGGPGDHRSPFHVHGTGQLGELFAPTDQWPRVHTRTVRAVASIRIGPRSRVQ